jgi:hypothetical protein
MKTISHWLKELYGLFVEDGIYAIAIVVWLVVCAIMLPHISQLSEWRAPLISFGLLVLLIENVSRAARRNK